MNEALLDKKRLDGLSLIILLSASIVFRFRVGNIGMGYLLTCFMLYEAMWVFFGENYSEVLGRILRSRYQKSKYKSARIIKRYASSMTYFQAALGGIFIAGLGSYLIRYVFKVNHSFYLIWFFGIIFAVRLISENIGGFLCSKKSSIRLYAAISVVRQILIAVFGNIFISVLSGYGSKIAALYKQDDFAALYSCFGICIAAILSELVVLILVLVMKLLSGKKESDFEDDYFQKKDNTGNVFLMIWQRRIFDVLNTLFMIFPFVFGVFCLYQKSADKYQAASDIGLFGGTVLFPGVIFCTLGYMFTLPIMGEISLNLRQGKMRYAQNHFQTAIHLCFIYGSFGCIYLISESQIIASMFEESVSSLVSKLMVYGAFLTLTMLASLFMLRLLVANGLTLLTYFVQIPSDVIFVVVLSIAIKKNPQMATAFALALLISFICKFIGYLIVSIVKLEMNLDPIGNLFVPMAVSAVVCVLNVFLAKVISPHLGNIFTLFVSFIEEAFVYLVILLLSRNIKENEIEYLPGKRLITIIAQTLHVL